MIEQPKQPPAKIVRTFLCERCGAEVNSDIEYKQHKADHTLGKIADKKIDPIKGPVEDTPPAPVVAPTPQAKAAAPWNKAEVKPTPKLNEPITLRYVFTGTCTCGAPIETIPLEVELDSPRGEAGKQKKFVVIAWCPQEKRNIQQRMVSKL